MKEMNETEKKLYDLIIKDTSEGLKLHRAESITLPIEDYNRLRKLEIKSEIKKLKQELKRL